MVLAELQTKLASLEEQHTQLLMTHEETVKELSSLKATFLSEKQDLELRVTELQENIALLNANSGDLVTQLQNATEEVTRDRDTLREELKSTREQLTREKQELEATHAELQAQLSRARKQREELEATMQRQQETQSQSMHNLRKHLLQHVHDMHVWKVFLEQEREYESEDLHIVMEAELEGMDFAEQVTTLDTAITEENERIAALTKEREKEFPESGKKKSKESSSSKSKENVSKSSKDKKKK